jgi:hypothetical protein
VIFFFETTQININPIYVKIDTGLLKEARQQIEYCIISNNIHFLILDRGFFDIIDPEDNKITGLDNATLYIAKEAKSIKITEILKGIEFSRTKSLKGVVLYTYDELSNDSDGHVEPAHLKNELIKIFGLNRDIIDIDIVLTNTEIYRLASLTLYHNNPQKIGVYQELGKKSDFKLYGLFMGEILYHRILRIIYEQQKKTLSIGLAP